MDDPLEIDEFLCTYCMCDRSGDNRQIFQEVEKQKCTHTIIRDCVDVIVKTIMFNSVPSIKS